MQNDRLGTGQEARKPLVSRWLLRDKVQASQSC